MTSIDCNKGTVHIFKHNNQIVIIDPGVIGRRLSAPSWCEYTLMPALAKQLGTNTIDHLIVLQPNRIIFEVLINLQEKICIKNIYIPFWQGDAFILGSEFYDFKTKLPKQNAGTLIRLGNKPITISNCTTITPLKNQIMVNEFGYPAFHVSVTIDKKTVSFYSAKHKPSQKKDCNGASQNSHDNCP